MQKAPHAISAILFITFFLVSCNTSKDIIESRNDDDYLLLNKLLNNISKQFPKNNINFKLSNNNEVVTSVVEELKKNDFETNKFKLDSLKRDIGIDSDKTFNEIFNPKEYDYLISQKQKLEWDFQKIKTQRVYKYEKDMSVDKQIIVQISKPIYTSNNKFALISVNKKSASYILIFKKNKNDWIEDKLFSPSLR